jgi:hypothetical protein
MIETGLEERAFPPPTPSWLIAFTVAAGYILILFGLDSVLPFQVLNPGFAPLAALGGALVYWAFLWLMDFRDPRIWRDPTRFTDYVRTWANITMRPMPDAGGMEDLRLEARRAGGIALAQQGGLVAGAAAGVTFLDYSGFLAVLVFGATMLMVGLALRRWLVGGE